jgi:hypothetical protein
MGMKAKQLCVLLIVLMGAVSTFGGRNYPKQTITLYSQNKYQSSKKFGVSFGNGISDDAERKALRNRTDLTYGSLYIGDDLDWFSASHDEDSRSRIKDLGVLSWSDSFEVSKLPPFPKLKGGETRSFIVDSSTSSRKAWKETNGIEVKAVVGHMYLIHIKDSEADFYILLHVEEIKRDDSCTISWKPILSPEQ